MVKVTKDWARIRARAEQLAATGEFSDFWAIEKVIEAEGYSYVKRALDDEQFRQRLKVICDAAKAKAG